jgi:hypothetical protein
MSFPLLPENVYLKIIYDATLCELLDYIKVKNNKKKVEYSLLINTHCKGCSAKNLVSLRGYVGQYCSKRCWKLFDDPYNSDFDEDRVYNHYDIYDKYYYILDDIDNVEIGCRAISKYHRSYYNGLSPSGKVWPMQNKPCYNECILNTKN